MLVRITLNNEDRSAFVTLELDSARDAARIQDEAAKLNILDKDKVTTDVIFSLASKLANNLLKDVEAEIG